MTQQTEREKFEAWHAVHHKQPLERFGDTYKNTHVRDRWYGWQARAALEAKQAVQWPEPLAWRYTDARGHYRYRGQRIGFAQEYPMLKPEPLYTEQQVRAMLATNGIGACNPACNQAAPAAPVPQPLTDEQISLEACNEDEGDWNSLAFKDCWHDGFNKGARATERAHGIGVETK